MIPIINILKGKLKNSFLKSVLMITGGTVVAQLINIIFLPIITRIYTPEEYGIIAIYVAILGSITFLGSMNYEMGIPIANNEKKAINLLVLSFFVLVTFTGVVIFITWLTGEKILLLINDENIETMIAYKYLIPVGVFLMGLYNISLHWAYREKNYKGITKTKVNQSLANNSITIALGITNFGSLGLLLGRISGQSAGISTLSFNLLTKSRSLFNKVNLSTILWLSKRYINFPLYTTPRRFLGDITISLPMIFIASLYGSQALGFFSLANSVIQLPMNLIGTSVSNVFYAESASLSKTNPKGIKELSKKLLKNLILIGAVPLIVLIFLGPWLFSLVFGEGWREAGIYASLLSIAVFSRLIFKPISNIFEIFEKQRVAFLLNVFRLVFVLLVFFLSKHFFVSSFWAVGMYSIAMSLIYFFQYLLAKVILNQAMEN